MTTTTSYGTWNSRADHYTLTLEQSVFQALDGYTDAEVAAVADAYRAAINAALPDSVSLCGDEFYGNYYDEDCTDQLGYPRDENGDLDIHAIIDGIDFWAIVEEVTAA